MAPVVLWLLLAGSVGVVVFWDRIRAWATERLADVVGRYFGSTARDYFLSAVVAVDNVVTGVRRAAREGWRWLRERVLQAAVTIERRTGSRFVKRLCAWVRRVVGTEQKVFRVVSEEEVPFEDLPDEVRAAFIQAKTPQGVTLSFGDELTQ